MIAALHVIMLKLYFDITERWKGRADVPASVKWKKASFSHFASPAAALGAFHGKERLCAASLVYCFGIFIIISFMGDIWMDSKCPPREKVGTEVRERVWVDIAWIAVEI